TDPWCQATFPCQVHLSVKGWSTFVSERLVNMKVNTSQVLVAIALAAAAFVALASIVDAVRTDSFGPIWAVGWLPAVFVGVLYRPSSGRQCWGRLGRRARS